MVRGSKPVGCEIFRIRPYPDWGPPSPLYNGYRFSFLGVKRPRGGVDHPPPSSAEVTETVKLYVYSLSLGFRDPYWGELYILNYIKNRADLRHGSFPGKLIIRHPFKQIFFKLFRLRTGLANPLNILRPRSSGHFGEEINLLLFPHFEPRIFQTVVKSLCRLSYPGSSKIEASMWYVGILTQFLYVLNTKIGFNVDLKLTAA
jgi:hypothetical protein